MGCRSLGIVGGDIGLAGTSRYVFSRSLLFEIVYMKGLNRLHRYRKNCRHFTSRIFWHTFKRHAFYYLNLGNDFPPDIIHLVRKDLIGFRPPYAVYPTNLG